MPEPKPHPRVTKVTVTKVIPLPNGEECMFYVSIGLTPVGVFGGPTGCVAVGQILELGGLKPYLDIEAKCQEMISELYDWGRSDTSIVEDEEEGTVWSVPSNYELLESATPERGLFLEAIWHLMRATGIMHVTDRYQFYGPRYDEVYEYMELGYRIAEYQWKFSHEEAASTGYKVRAERQEGQRIAADNRAAESKVKDERLLKLAKVLIKDNSELARNDAALAREIEGHPKCPERLGQPGIRKRLGRLRKEGKL